MRVKSQWYFLGMRLLYFPPTIRRGWRWYGGKGWWSVWFNCWNLSWDRGSRDIEYLT